MTAKKAATAKVVIRAPFKATWAGVPYWPGTVAEVPPWVAQEWVKIGIADPVDDEPGPEAEPTGEQADTGQAEQPKAEAAKPKRTKRTGDG